MGKLIVPFLASILVLCLLAGCGGDDDDDDNIIGPDDASALLFAMEPGDWAEHRDPDGNRDISKFIGEDTWEGRSCFVLEFETHDDGERSVSQVWIDKANGEAVLLVVEMDGKVMKMGLSTLTDVPGEDNAWDEPDAEEVRTEKYTTPTDKTVEVTVYRIQDASGVSEDWVSSEVPFNLVKELLDGELVSSLYDFGTGADRSILKQEAENAEPFQIPTIPNNDVPIVPNIPDDAADEPDNGNAEQEGQIVITVGDGARPKISVSQPVSILTISRAAMIWGFGVDDQAPALPGPFQYGVVPQGAVLIGLPDPADMQPGQTYNIQAIGDVQVGIPLMGSIVFVR